MTVKKPPSWSHSAAALRGANLARRMASDAAHTSRREMCGQRQKPLGFCGPQCPHKRLLALAMSGQTASGARNVRRNGFWRSQCPDKRLLALGKTRKRRASKKPTCELTRRGEADLRVNSQGRSRPASRSQGRSLSLLVEGPARLGSSRLVRQKPTTKQPLLVGGPVRHAASAWRSGALGLRCRRSHGPGVASG